MNILKFLSIILVSSILVSCEDDSQCHKPIKSGIIESGLVWKYPLNSGSNSGLPIKKGSKVDLYENIIIIYLDDGSKQIEQLSSVTKLVIR